MIRAFGSPLASESPFNQDSWHVGKLAGSTRLPSLRRLIDKQREFIAAFAEIVRRPDEQVDVLRDIAFPCLAA